MIFLVIVHGTIQNRPNRNSLDFEIELNVESISEKDMPIPESTKLIVDAINKKYKVNYPYSSFINPLLIK